VKKENNPFKKALILTAIITEMLRKKKVMPILVHLIFYIYNLKNLFYKFERIIDFFVE